MGFDGREQVEKRVPTLNKHAEEILEIAPGVVNDFGAWSALKLIVHVATVNMYTTVAPNYFDDWFYVDALAGSGVSTYEEMEDCFKGSAILAAEHAEEQFTKMYFVEGCEKKANALRQRLEAVFKGDTGVDAVRPEFGYEVIHGNANAELSNVYKDMRKIGTRGGGSPYYHSLAFVDNQGLDVQWDAIEDFSDNAYCDFLITFPLKAVLQNKHNPDTLNDFFGSQIWTKANDMDEYAEKYCNRLSGITKSTQVTTNVHSGIKNYQYDVIYATKEDAEYANAIRYVRDFVEDVTGADVEEMIDVMYGEQSSMAEYLPETDDHQSNPQTSLGDY